MRIAVVGGGSTYTPELVDGLGRMRDVLPVDELVLVDPDTDRLELVGAFGRRILARLGHPAALVTTTELDPALEFTAVTTGNPHLVALVDKYVESDLIAMGERVATRPDVFPAGANLSVLLQLEPAEVFVRTFERGAGLTASCGSGMAAARAVYSRVTPVDPARRVTVRNAGGMATVSLNVRQGRWHPVLEGNATFVYRAEVDPAALARDAVEPCDDEVRAYAALDERNAARLREAGVTG